MYQNYRNEELGKKSTELGIIFDVMVTGVTGAGKSTTLNTIFQKEVAKVGRGVDPETMNLNSYRLNDSFREPLHNPNFRQIRACNLLI